MFFKGNSMGPDQTRIFPNRSNLRPARDQYGLSRWRRARLGHLRSHPLCEHCKSAGKLTSASLVDHRIPHRGDLELFWDRSNWQSLCKACHDGWKQRQERNIKQVDARGWNRTERRQKRGKGI